MRFPGIIAAILFTALFLPCQGQTDVSLYLKKNPAIQLDSISSRNGNMFHKLGHHGPAVENPWLAFRLYFDKRTAIDLYTKAEQGTELHDYRWYPPLEKQLEGYGADCYKVGKSMGLGGIRLWDGNKTVPLHPVSLRSARVFQGKDSSYMEMRSEGVKYRGNLVNVLIRLTVYPHRREARVQAFSLSGEMLQFATGINYFKSLDLTQGDGHIATWGLHPEDLAAIPTEVGAAILYREKDFEKKLNDGKQVLLISRPCREIQTWITAAGSRDEELHTPALFINYLNHISSCE